jgi:septal ring factor EnvC (AmiA/AmiB activator)
MRRPLAIVTILIAVVLAVAAAVLYGNNQKTKAQLASSQTSVQESEDRYTKTIDAIAEIQDSLNAISAGEGAAIVPGASRAEQNAGGANGQAALDRIAMLRQSIQASKDRIAALESNLKKSGMKVNGLQRLVADLKKNVAEREMEVAALTTRVDSLNTQVTGLTATVTEREDTLRTRDVQIEDKRRELATVYYAVGSKGDLKKAGVIQSSGGVLGLGKTVLPAANPDPNAFTAMDTDQSQVIHISSAKARVISAQPATSYELLPTGGGVDLRITNAAEFRKVKQVVILTS